MEIDIEKFERWVYDRFPKVRNRGDEYCVDSIFQSDRKQHLWINPYKNAFHCWKSDESGSIPSLISKVDHCSFEEAATSIVVDPKDLRRFDSVLEKLKRKAEIVQKDKRRKSELFPEGYEEFQTGTPEIFIDYLLDRKIDPTPYDIGYCREGTYSPGIVLPVFDEDGLLVYWTVRMLEGEERYREPAEGVFSGTKEDVIWSGKKWPKTGTPIFLLEGIIDAISLRSCGFPAISVLGSSLSDNQIFLLKKQRYQVILAMDNDKKGRRAEKQMYRSLIGQGIEVLGSVSTPGEEDWNELFRERGRKFLRDYIPKNIKRMDLASRVRDLLSDV